MVCVWFEVTTTPLAKETALTIPVTPFIEYNSRAMNERHAVLLTRAIEKLQFMELRIGRFLGLITDRWVLLAN